MDYTYEHNAYLRGFTAVCGIDEAGRGPLAGAGLRGSGPAAGGARHRRAQRFEEAEREKARAAFPRDSGKRAGLWHRLCRREGDRRDQHFTSDVLAMRRAFDAMQRRCDYVLVDGNRMPPMPVPGETVVKGDAKSPSIAAASILAKVSRDRVMLEYAKQYPEYQFEKHKGYGTKAHVEALRAFGPSPIHRRTFLKKILG
jgi:ribonuclease HII